jgi:predicted RNase H-like nuclease (RuvC/YqgF family)
MESLLAKLPYAEWVMFIVVLVMGGAAGVYMLDGYRDKKKVKQDGADDRLIGILEKTVKEMETKVNKLVIREQELTKEVAELRRDNEKLISILQGRDAQTQEFFKQAYDTMKISRETHALVVGLARSVEVMVSALGKKS